MENVALVPTSVIQFLVIAGKAVLAQASGDRSSYKITSVFLLIKELLRKCEVAFLLRKLNRVLR